MKKLDLSKKKFGRLTAIKVVETGKKRKWLCKCDCGNFTKATTFCLTSGNNKSCGCLRKVKTDLTNREFGLLKVLKEVPKENGDRCRRWLFGVFCVIVIILCVIIDCIF
jgi:hypothetical protein